MAELPRSTRALLDLLHTHPAGPLLDVGSSGGAVAREFGGSYLHVDLTACEAARSSGLTDVLHSDTLPAGPYAAIAFDAREWDAALAAEFVERTAGALSPGGVLLTTARREDVAPHFARVEAVGDALVASQPRPSAVEIAWSSYTFAFGGRDFTVRTAPGIFSPRGLDAGTSAMLDVIAAAPPRPGARFLDLGCGAGVVSMIATELWGLDTTAVDVNARALRISTANAPRANVVASDGFRQVSGATPFDIIASNPPYHTDFAVAKQFIEGAYHHLSMGGTLYLVVKRADWYVQKVRAIFGGCRVTEQEGYSVITAEKRPPKTTARPEPAQPTTKKHAKRLAASNGRKRPR